jgi:hypothetical protein
MMDNSNHSAGSFVIEKSADGRILARETGDPLEDEWEVVPNRRRLRRPNLKQVRQKGKQLHKSFRKISKKESFSWCKVCSYCAPILVLIMAAIGLVFATGAVQISSDDGAPTNTLDSSDITDPFEGEDVPQWPSNGAGLEVEIVNALSKELDVIFDSVTSDWDLGNPDGVTLFTQKEGQDAGCKPISGKIKACNGDYGGTKWRGSTDTMLNSDGEIESSTVRLNNFYLVPDTRGAWQYTLCHEIGRFCICFVNICYLCSQLFTHEFAICLLFFCDIRPFSGTETFRRRFRQRRLRKLHGLHRKFRKESTSQYNEL